MDVVLLMRFWVAKAVCGFGKWFVERGIEIAGEGCAEVWFEASLVKPLPRWLTATGYAFALVCFWAFVVVLFAATGGE